MVFLRCFLLVLLMASPLRAEEPYDLIFKTGTLDGIPETTVLEYERVVESTNDAEYAERNTGAVKLDFQPDEMARLRFYQGEKHRDVGKFPATVGNPVIMYFVETVLRDMAKEAGGSPFYIRNRIKDALVSPAEIRDVTTDYDGREIAAREISLKPFEDDKNRDRMGAFADLELTFVMSEEAPGWYRSLTATAPGKDGKPAYSSRLVLISEAK